MIHLLGCAGPRFDMALNLLNSVESEPRPSSQYISIVCGALALCLFCLIMLFLMRRAYYIHAEFKGVQ